MFLKLDRVNSSLSVHVANNLVAVKVADDKKIRPLLLLIMSLVIAKTQELIASDFQCDRSIIVLIQQSGRADAVTVFLHIAWNGKALSRHAVACNTKTFNLPQRRGVFNITSACSAVKYINAILKTVNLFRKTEQVFMVRK